MKLSASALAASALLAADVVSARCLEAVISSSNVDRYPTAAGFVTVCFNPDSDETDGTLDMFVTGLKASTTGGVHIHTGTSCSSTDAQGPHYFNPSTGDPWFNAPNPLIAPTGAGYDTDAEGTGRGNFNFDQGYGYDATNGRVVVVHDTVKPEGDFERVACGVLRPAGMVSREKWFADSTDNACRMDCATGIFNYCGGVQSQQAGRQFFDSASACCSGSYNWMDNDLCSAIATNTHTNMYYADFAENRCSRDCEEGTGTCTGYPDDLAEPLFETASACCSTRLGWLDTDACAADSSDVSLGGCLQARMTSSNDNRYSTAEGYVTVCFDGALSATSGTLSMFVKNLNQTTTGGVHIHTGTSCASAASQLGHYFNPSTGDPWFPTVNATIAPTATNYDTDAAGTGRADFQFDQGYGLDDTVGRVVVIHDTLFTLGGDYTRVACGVLTATTEKVGTKKWYADPDSENGMCVQDCATGFEEGCGGLRADSYVPIYETVQDCCSERLYWIDSDLCAALSTTGYTNKYYVDYENQKCAKDCEEGTGNCAGSPEDTSLALFDSAQLCCATMLGWLNTDTCVADTNNGGCLEARMTSSNDNRYSTAEGYVTVCFDGALSATSGTLSMYVKNLNQTTTGGVHIHTGTSCASAASQLGHYFNPITGDPWFPTVNATIAPTATNYDTDAAGTGRADFQFDQGYGLDDTVGRVVVIHDTLFTLGGDYTRVACGVLGRVEDVGTKKWYVDSSSEDRVCQRDCEVGREEGCGGIKDRYSFSFFDTLADCCAGRFSYVDAELCQARATGTHTNKYYVDYAENRCSRDCDEGTGTCAGYPENLAETLFDDASACCSAKLGWLDQDACVATSTGVGAGGCLQARLRSSNDNRYPNADGYVTVCFDGALSATSGTLDMYVRNLNQTTTGGVHIHTGTSCASAASQLGHYFNPSTGDPWFPTVNATIAPTATNYNTNAAGTGRAIFQFDQGYGLVDTVGRVVVAHDTLDSLDGDYARVACGVLTEVTGTVGTKMWYAGTNSESEFCVQDCEAGFEDHCGGLRENNFVPLYDSVSDCCAAQYSYVNSELCETRSTGTFTNKYYVNWIDQNCVQDCDGCTGEDLDDLTVLLFGTPEDCCANMLGWLDSSVCAANSGGANCLQASISSSNGNTFPNADGTVTVCFDGRLSATSGTLQMRVENLRASIVGGVHIHEGRSCASATSQMGHYFNPSTGDPWFPTVNATIAPTATNYNTNAAGTGTADFQFDQGFEYADTIGRVVVVHDELVANNGTYARIACGVLVAAPLGTDQWYVDWISSTCVRDCEGSAPCGGLAESHAVKYSTSSACCDTMLPWLTREDCLGS